MKRVGILAEKPSQARNFAKAFGGMSGVTNLSGEPVEYVIAAARGHLYELKQPSQQVSADKQDRYKSWDLNNLPWDRQDIAFKFSVRGDVRSVVADIKRAFKACDEIVIATDDDPTYEGTALACEIIQEAPLHAREYSRMYFVDESAPQVAQAFKTRKVIPNISTFNEWITARFRSRWDYMAGLQLTRAASSFAPYGTFVRTGRLKSAMVVLVGNQLAAYNNYVKKPYFTSRFVDDHDVVYLNDKSTKYLDKVQAEAEAQAMHQSGVVTDSTKQKSIAPPKLLDLAALSALLAPKGLSAKTVLATYQKMYEAQVVSYPRTEDKTITPEQFAELAGNVDKIARLVGVDPKKLTVRNPRSSHVKPQGAHGANRPGPNVPNSLAALSQYGTGAEDIYRILALSALRMFAPDKHIETVSGHVADYPDYKGSLTHVLDPGWSALLKDDTDDDADTASAYTTLGSTAKPGIREGVNPRPPRPTMKWLFKQLEKYDCGTGATRTSTYADCCTNTRSKKKAGPSTALFADKRGKIELTEVGSLAYGILPGTKIGSLELSAEILQQMRDIHDGKLDPDVALDQIADMVRHDLAIMQDNVKKLSVNINTMSTNNKKGHTLMVDTQERFETHDDTGAAHQVKRVWRGHRFSDDEIQQLNNGQEVVISGLQAKSGKTYDIIAFLGWVEWDAQDGTHKRAWGVDSRLPERKNEKANNPDYFEVTNPKTGRTAYVKRVYRGVTLGEHTIEDLKRGERVTITPLSKAGKPYEFEIWLGENTFSNEQNEQITYYGICGDFPKIPSEFCRHRFTSAEKQALLSGKTIHVDNMVSKAGKQFEADVKYDESERRIKLEFNND